ncbi:methyltransferase domain-containing protein [Altericroceibacterium endophyticum]|uniref:Methyltransferase domain-containing protein n=1 Tax=Altericroceibacterium endophyticum TaxID=1808508 RepID=A0A6I4TA74_9SPHN|nr:methyltransferase domain-containing protein [Altericroceibacterium endophyticum]MXO67071.1 methyltransferase domain-containing protein [Altericroceibacterium endophyticum]
MNDQTLFEGATKPRPFEAGIYKEFDAGQFSRKDCTVAFYTRVDALLNPTVTLLNLGAGRGANIVADYSSYRRKIQTFSGRVAKVIGLDVDPAVEENPDLDEAYVIDPSGKYPLLDESIDIIVSDHVLEHVDDPQGFAAEIDRVLKPGGWFCARTPTKWGYIGIATRSIPNSLHVRLLSRLQPQRKAEDVFPTRYRLNSISDLRDAFPPERWRHCSYGYNGVPSYHANRSLFFRMIDVYNWLMPNTLSAKFHVFLQKRPDAQNS